MKSVSNVNIQMSLTTCFIGFAGSAVWKKCCFVVFPNTEGRVFEQCRRSRHLRGAARGGSAAVRSPRFRSFHKTRGFLMFYCLSSFAISKPVENLKTLFLLARRITAATGRSSKSSK